MGKVLIDLSMSLDGFITGPHPDIEHGLGHGGGTQLHEWLFSGDTPNPRSEMFKPAPGSEAIVEDMIATTGAFVIGRTLYDFVNGWDGSHPIKGAAVVVLTHNVPDNVPQGDSPISFVTDGIANAIARGKEAAGDKDVTILGASIAQQSLKAELVDEIHIHLVPILLGDGVQLFAGKSEIIALEPIKVTQAEGVTHLRFRVGK